MGSEHFSLSVGETGVQGRDTGDEEPQVHDRGGQEYCPSAGDRHEPGEERHRGPRVQSSLQAWPVPPQGERTSPTIQNLPGHRVWICVMSGC